MRNVLAILLLGASACGASGVFGMSADDNNPAALAAALKQARPPKAGAPLNGVGKPLLFAVTIGSAQNKKLIAYDLAAGKTLWEVQADVTSRVVVGGDFVAAREGKNTIVARSIQNGAPVWKAGLGDKQKFLGAAADGDKVFYVIRNDGGAKRSWELVALGPGGQVLWSQVADGPLGSPGARGGLVFMPFMTQWISILDAANGKQLTRILQKDEALSYVHTTSDGVYYGSKGVLFLDENSAEGTKEGATYASAKLPSFVKPIYGFDAYNDVQAGYSAFDRNRLLWRSKFDDKGMWFADDQTVVFTYRFFFAFDAEGGQLRWAHQHPRYDVVAADHTGEAIVFLSQEGELGALDPRTGALLAESKLDHRILGASFDADGFRPSGEGTPARSASTLAAIVADRDARFNTVKLFAIESLGSLDDADVTPTLLGILQDDKTPKDIYAKAAEVIVARKDEKGLPALVAALEVKNNFLTGARPRAVDVVARALGTIGKPDGAPALITQFLDPETPIAAVAAIATALGQCGNKAALAPLRAFVLMYRSDPLFASDTTAISAAMDALLALGGSAERELLAYVASEPRTQEKVAEYARRALSQTGKAAPAPK